MCAVLWTATACASAPAGPPEPGASEPGAREAGAHGRVRAGQPVGHGEAGCGAARALLLPLVAGRFAEAEERLQIDLWRRRAELRAEILRRADRRRQDLAAIAVAQLEAALAGRVERVRSDLRAAQAAPFPDRDRARELELATELSTLLAAIGRESASLRGQHGQRVAQARDEALALVDRRVDRWAAGPALALSPERTARELLGDATGCSGDDGLVRRIAVRLAEEDDDAERFLTDAFLRLRAEAFALLEAVP